MPVVIINYAPPVADQKGIITWVGIINYVVVILLNAIHSARVRIENLPSQQQVMIE